jgi:exodeoxyribonuclease VII large subunit
VRLQGQQAARDIAETIYRLSVDKACDVIVLVRGGGRAAELATFNDLAIAEAICQSNIPVLTGIGHQRDETLADIVADVSTITPTAAAIHLAKQKPVPAQESAVNRSSSWKTYAVAAIVAVVIIVLLILALTPR